LFHHCCVGEWHIGVDQLTAWNIMDPENWTGG